MPPNVADIEEMRVVRYSLGRIKYLGIINDSNGRGLRNIITLSVYFPKVGVVCYFVMVVKLILGFIILTSSITCSSTHMFYTQEVNDPTTFPVQFMYNIHVFYRLSLRGDVGGNTRHTHEPQAGAGQNQEPSSAF